MNDRIPLPTDNIYKFYALFGLLLLIFGAGSFLYVTTSTNDLIFSTVVEYETLNADPIRSVSDETRFRVLQRKLELAYKNKKFLLNCQGIIIGVGLLMMFYGFKKWHTEVQPIQDEMARLSLVKLQQEVAEDKSVKKISSE